MNLQIVGNNTIYLVYQICSLFTEFYANCSTEN